ncbi:unnamed protein product [Lasius platythorax]|uniref:Jouberin n=1 Tax=Lasius platythorax TaxID=488582 RepID=A0AAV2NW45_9HYME
MAKSAESTTRGRILRRSRNVSSFLEESTESATSPSKATMSVVVDVHNENSMSRQRRDDENGPAIELSDDKETKGSSQSSKVSSRASEASRNRSADRGTKSRRSSNDRSHRSHDEVMTIVSLDLIEESGNKNDSLEEKPRRRKQWNAATNETETMDSKRPARKRWSKDTGIIRLPETSDDASPLIDDSRRKVPVPAPRRSNATLVYDNPAFVSEDEVLRIETDHNRESTRIEMGRMGSDRSNVDEADSTSGGSSRKQRQSERRTAMSSDSRSSRTTRSLNGRKNSAGEPDSSTSLGRVTDEVRSSSMASEDRTSSGDGKLQPEATTKRDRASRGRERPLFEKKNKLPVSDEVIGSSAAKDTIDSTVKRKKRKKRKQEKEGTRKDERRYISVTIHRAEVLEADYANVKRPMVMVHIVEARTGSYLKNGGAYLRPLITGKFDFRENRSMIPVWEEELVFEHDFDAIVRREDGDRAVILFEVIDLLSFAEASRGYDRVGSEGCWNKIAWAFLKPVGVNNILHTDKKVRLQLYRPRRSSKRYGKHTCEVYTWWQSNNRDKYPSSLLVTVTSVPSSKQESVLYQQLPLNDLLDDAREDNDSRRRLSAERRTSDSTIGLPKWARLAAQSCKIPNEKMFETEASENGCFYVAFSNDGKYLACVHSEEYDYPIVVYEIETGKIHVRFLGHKTFVYSLNWSSDDYHLLSASADQTARIWDIRNQIVQHIEMLPHPSYVYCARYAPGKMTIVATGCYDGVARIWANENGRSTKRELSQELEGHEGFVSSMVFQKNGNLITADSVGSIILWTVRRNSRMSSRSEWCVARRIKLPEIEGIVINTIVLHPLESRLLVHSRDNGLRMVDLATGVVLRKYKQLNNQRIQLRACISPCGGLILCGGEDSVLNIWNLETGKHVAKYANDGRNSSRAVITCVDYHPYDHMLAFSTFGNPASVRVLRFNKNASGNDIGLNLLTEDASRACGNEVIMNVSEHSLSRQGKFSGGTTARKEIFSSSSCRPANDHTIQIESDDCERPWTTLRRLKDMERCWRERSRNRLHCIIEKIDLMLSKSSLFFEDEGERVSSRINERRRSWIRANTSTSSDIVPKEDILLQDSAANSIRYHEDDPKDDNNARSSSASRSRSQNCSLAFRNSISASFERMNAPELSSPDSAGTYVVEMPDLNENADEVAVIAEKMDSTRLSDSSLASNVTFIIENERT